MSSNTETIITNDVSAVKDNPEITTAEPVKKFIVEDKQTEREVAEAAAVVPDARSEIYNKYDENREELLEIQEKTEGLSEEEKEAIAPGISEEIITVKINGVLRRIEKSKVDDAGGLVAYQKQVAGDEKLKEAAETQKLLDARITEMRDMEADLAARELALSNGVKPADELTTENTVTDLPDINEGDQQELKIAAKAYNTALYNGKEDDAADQLLKLIAAANGNSTAIMDLDELSEAATTKAVEVIEQRNNTKLLVQAYQSFKEDDKYKAIFKDEDLYTMVDRQTTAIHQEHPEWTHEQVMSEAGDIVLEWDANRKPEEEATATTVVETDLEIDKQVTNDKLVEKRASSLPQAGDTRKPSNPAPHAESNKDYINRLRIERGLEAPDP
jgi:hypothetical protein